MAEQRMVGKISASRLVNTAGEFLASGEFAVVIVCLVMTWTAAMVGIILWPQTFDGISVFTSSFKVWCFGYDPESGHFNLSKVLLLFLDPLFFAAALGYVWRNPLAELWKSRRRVIGFYLLFSALIVASILVAVAKYDAQQSDVLKKSLSDLRLERTSEVAPQFELLDQNGQPYQLKKNRVTIVSAFYAHCAHTCPRIIQQARSAIAKSKIAQSEVDVAMVTMDPENDTVDALIDKAETLELEKNWHLLTGNSVQVNAVLDAYKVARARQSDGTIGHSNIFYVVDRRGKLAFRIGLGSPQEIWLRQAIELLVREGE